jgi:hypothetical protein
MTTHRRRWRFLVGLGAGIALTTLEVWLPEFEH